MGQGKSITNEKTESGYIYPFLNQAILTKHTKAELVRQYDRLMYDNKEYRLKVIHADKLVEARENQNDRLIDIVKELKTEICDLHIKLDEYKEADNEAAKVMLNQQYKYTDLLERVFILMEKGL